MKNRVTVVSLFMTCLLILSLNLFSQPSATDTTLAKKYFVLADKYYSSGNLDSSSIYYQNAADIYKPIALKTNDPGVWRKFINCLNRISNNLTSQYRLDEAQKLLDTALVYSLKYLHEKNLETANLLNGLGTVYGTAGEYDKALDYYFQSLQIKKELLGEKHPDIAVRFNNIGIIYNLKGEYYKALEYHSKALQIRQEILGEKHPAVAMSFDNIGLVYSNSGEYNKALDYYFKSLQIKKEILSEKHPDLSKSYVNIGLAYSAKGEYDKALDYYFQAQQIKKEILGEMHPDISVIYNNIANIYISKNQYDKALEYHFKALQIRREILGEKHPGVVESYYNIGWAYIERGEYTKSLEFLFNALQIGKEVLSEKHPTIGYIYNTIGNNYYFKREYDLALEYALKSLHLRKEILGEKHPDLISNYNNIANIYADKNEKDLALEYYNMALEIGAEKFGEKHPEVALLYDNIGITYFDKGEYERALEYYLKALQIIQEVLGEKHLEAAGNYEHIGSAYHERGEYDQALDYYFKALQIRKELLGEKHTALASSYDHIGRLYKDKGENDLALEYYQKEVASCLGNFYETANVYTVPVNMNILDWNYLLKALQEKAQIISDENEILKGFTDCDRNKIAIRHYQACDTVIDITRKEISTLSDKLALGLLANQAYKNAIDLLIPFQTYDNTEGMKSISDKDADLAFYFSEKNKSAVLLEALAGQEAQKYAGIPDSLLEKEHNLKTDINLYTKKLAEPENLDSTQVVLFQDRLFHSNRSYDSLIVVFEKKFPQYHNLKYNNKTITVKDIQKLLDKKTALRSFAVGDSSITIFTLTKSKLNVQKVPKIKNLSDSIVWFRYGLTKTSPRMQENFRRLGYKLYQQLFPQSGLIARQIENLIIIPDDELAIIPFESLLTTNYTGDINAYNNYPYLIKKYKISYSYSANLFYMAFSNEASSTIEIKKLDDWLAFAPVFDISREQNMVMTTRELQRQLNWLNTDSLMTNRSMFDRSYITPLPATVTETEAIFKLYDDNNLKAKVLLHNNANEKLIKSGELEHFKVLHFATHGFVNSERPELSGLLLEQDTTGGEDGILYSGEIYNLKLNSDLVVLSACETGLGKIQKGEGIIGLTRALLYAGAKNIIVSLWQVADDSTSDLMVNFYKNSLAVKGHRSFSESLRNAKLNMISNGKYAHPLFWSPFILIGN